ncbi:hypothetical protein KKB44_02855 [Candidatus Micrarchaeota archaeon]|nr:hypothetical protein [Candidatus Micrarchaeota archaeon]
MRTLRARVIILLLTLLSTSFALVIESGDGGAEFAQETIELQCQGENVQAVYQCLGNVVRVVSSVPGEGSTFYKPDGGVIYCPVVQSSELGAECLRMMMPNYCPEQAECGNSPPQIFPGQNDSPEESGDVDYYVIVGEAASDELEEPVIQPPAEESLPPETVILIEENELDVHTATPGAFDFALGNLIWIILFLGVGSIGVLFMLFKKSINEELE